MLPSLRQLLRPPDPSLVEAGIGGERLVAKTRLFFWLSIAAAPLGATLAGGLRTPREVWILLGASLVAVAISAALVWYLEPGMRVDHLGFWTGAGDVSILSLALVAVAFADRPQVVVDSKAVWAVYLLAVLATSLRFDVRICFLAGGLAVAQYTLLVVWMTLRHDLPVVLYSTGSGEEVELLIQIARVMLMVAATALAACVVYRSRLLVEASGTDRLTGLGNRAFFEERLASELARARREGEPLTLAFLDLDRFKAFNDRWGHEAGDSALRLVARVLREASREEDVLARWGGEEFVLVLPKADLEGATRVVERVREQLSAATVKVRGSEEARLTLSAGLARFDPENGDDPEALLQVADRRLYAAKQAGRDRVVSTG